MIKKLEWDSKFFGFGIAHLELKDSNANLSSLSQYLSDNNISLVQCLCDEEDSANIDLLKKNSFCFVDQKLTYRMELAEQKHLSHHPDVFLAAKEHIPELQDACHGLFDSTRYYNKYFKPELADAMYQTWLNKSVLGQFDDYCLMVESQSKAAGFLTCKLLDKQAAQIGLFGVRQQAQGKGLGQQLLAALLENLKQKSVSILHVATSGRSISAQNFYSSNGFLLCRVENWYYLQR